MLAALCRSYGGPDVVRVEEVPAPSVGAGQVRVSVHAAAVNFPDILLVADKYQVSVPVPFVPGSEFAGVVTEVGDQVSDRVSGAAVGDRASAVALGDRVSAVAVGDRASAFAVGDRVSGTTIVGAFAEEIVVSAQAVTGIPPGVEDAAAAAFGVAHRTAYHVLRSVAALRPGEELVVLGAGGGVGLAAVQLGTVLGATVTAVASTKEKLDIARSFGAVRLVDHRSGDLRRRLRELLPEGADVVVDPVGGEIAEPALRSLRWGGRFVTVGYASGTVPRIALNLVLLKGIHILGFQFRDFALHAPDELVRNERELMELFSDHRAFPHIGATFDLQHVSDALRFVADGRAIGKVVLQVRK